MIFEKWSQLQFELNLLFIIWKNQNIVKNINKITCKCGIQLNIYNQSIVSIPWNDFFVAIVTIPIRVRYCQRCIVWSSVFINFRNPCCFSIWISYFSLLQKAFILFFYEKRSYLLAFLIDLDLRNNYRNNKIMRKYD